MNIDIYTDGSCIGNPGPGGWAAIIIGDGETFEISGGQPETTNNRMEMMAMIEAMEFVKTKFAGKIGSLKINIFSDSNLIVRTLNEGWKRKANIDLWEKIDAGREGLDISWTWVKAHANNRLNNRVDELAQREARKF